MRIHGCSSDVRCWSAWSSLRLLREVGSCSFSPSCVPRGRGLTRAHVGVNAESGRWPWELGKLRPKPTGRARGPIAALVPSRRTRQVHGNAGVQESRAVFATWRNVTLGRAVAAAILRDFGGIQMRRARIARSFRTVSHLDPVTQNSKASPNVQY